MLPDAFSNNWDGTLYKGKLTYRLSTKRIFFGVTVYAPVFIFCQYVRMYSVRPPLSATMFPIRRPVTLKRSSPSTILVNAPIAFCITETFAMVEKSRYRVA